MSNRQLIKAAHIWALTALIACGLWIIAGKAGIRRQGQNSNQNSNTSNANSTQNRNANRSANRNTGGATGQRTGMASLSSQDRNFIREAAMGGMMEVELGRVATQRGASEAVKQFGQRMVDDHSKVNTELMSLASSKGITLPTTLDERHQQEVTRLSGLSGAEFDRAYARRMVSEHNKQVALFERESTRGDDADLKGFATNTLPTLQEHLKLAKALSGEGGNSNRGGPNSNRNSNDNSNRP